MEKDVPNNARCNGEKMERWKEVGLIRDEEGVTHGQALVRVIYMLLVFLHTGIFQIMVTLWATV